MDKKISTILEKYSITYAGSAISDPDDQALSYVFVEVTRDSRNRQDPSNRTLALVKAALARKRCNVEFVLVDAGSRDLETGLRATLLQRHGSLVRNAFMSAAGKKVQVWVDPKRALSLEQISRIAKTARILVEAVGMSLESVVSTSGANLPSKTVCLQALRLRAPMGVEGLAQELMSKGLKVPSNDWVCRRLDSMRKSGSVVRNPGGTYVLSGSALRQLGTSKDKSSPDIKRLLAIAAGRL